jgi:hypothetical protein
MKKVVRLSESELTRLIKTVVKETKRNRVNEDVENFFNPEAMSTGGAIKDFYSQLRNTEGKEQEAMELKSIIQDYESNQMNSDEEEYNSYDSDENFTGMETPMGDMQDEEPRDPMAESIRRHIRRR